MLETALSSLSGLPAFLIYFVLAIALLFMFTLMYTWITPHNELELIRANNAAAAIAFGGALVGFASFVPERITALYAAVAGDRLAEARRIYDDLAPLTELVYGASHPSWENYPRMKTAMRICGRLSSDLCRRPIEPRPAETRAEIVRLLEAAGLEPGEG